MKFAEYLRNLNELAKTNPNTLEMEVVSSIDDEGNGYNSVYYGPGLGIFDEEEREFYSITDKEWLDEIGKTEDDANAICIN